MLNMEVLVSLHRQEDNMINQKLVFYAPNVHTGGGLVLLKNLIATWPGGELILILDSRARKNLELPINAKVYWVLPSLKSRIKAEFLLWHNSAKNVKVLCFHGLPPLLRSSGNVVSFLQNRNYICANKIPHITLWTMLRINMERLIFRLLRHRVSLYIVQTPSMRDALSRWYSETGGSVPESSIRVIPFFEKITKHADTEACLWDFIYVADGEAHKNHRNLIRAWQLLADEGIKPSLCLTLHERNSELKLEINEVIKKCKLEIYDLGELSRENIIQQYCKTHALIFPSCSESFGLPLIEANFMGLPILASEMDYVRDVCVPNETFDPSSPLSIARAVKRFLGYPDAPISLKDPGSFWDEVLGDFEGDDTHKVIRGLKI